MEVEHTVDLTQKGQKYTMIKEQEVGIKKTKRAKPEFFASFWKKNSKGPKWDNHGQGNGDLGKKNIFPRKLRDTACSVQWMFAEG